ncbi:amidohydrolase family protein, partial [Candidatus Bathyarchaeota archaeon]|nr:amidohydrolase family protein [Candidatus Bathyarchaeota archaeon]
MSLDLVIRNGRIIDGAGNPWYYGDVGIKDGKIAVISHIKVKSAREIDAKGLIVAPGFIDAHSHGDFNTLIYRQMENIIHQGITTVMAGQCGSSPAPLSDLIREEAQRGSDAQLPEGISLELSWSSFDEYLKMEEKTGLGANTAHMVGHGAIRSAAMGNDARAPRKEELQIMRKLMKEAMLSGAYG